MRGLDTNILVRYLTKDDQAQWQLASNYLEAAQANDEMCLINNIVLCEVVWVLRSVYKFSKTDILKSLDKIIAGNLFTFEDEFAVQTAIEQFRQGNADFSDYLIGQSNQQSGCKETATFDQKLKNASGFRLL